MLARNRNLQRALADRSCKSLCVFPMDAGHSSESDAGQSHFSRTIRPKPEARPGFSLTPAQVVANLLDQCKPRGRPPASLAQKGLRAPPQNRLQTLLTGLRDLVSTPSGIDAFIKAMPAVADALFELAPDTAFHPAMQRADIHELICQRAEAYAQAIEEIFGIIMFHIADTPDYDGGIDHALAIKQIADLLRHVVISNREARRFFANMLNRLLRDLRRGDYTQFVDYCLDEGDVLLSCFSSRGQTRGFVKSHGDPAAVVDMKPIVKQGVILRNKGACDVNGNASAKVMMDGIDKATYDVLLKPHGDTIEPCRRIKMAHGRSDFNYVPLGRTSSSHAGAHIYNIFSLPLELYVKRRTRRQAAGHGIAIVHAENQRNSGTSKIEARLAKRRGLPIDFITNDITAAVARSRIYESIYVFGHHSAPGYGEGKCGPIPLHGYRADSQLILVCNGAERQKNGFSLTTNLPLSALMNGSHSAVCISGEIPDFLGTLIHIAIEARMRSGSIGLIDATFMARNDLLNGRHHETVSAFLTSHFDELIGDELASMIVRPFAGFKHHNREVDLIEATRLVPSLGLMSFLSDADLIPIYEQLEGTHHSEWEPLVSLLVKNLIHERRDDWIKKKKLPDAVKLLLTTCIRAYGPGV